MFAQPIETTEGYLPLTIPSANKPCQTWYKIFGSLTSSSNTIPLITLHGGPGAGHEYLLPISRLHTTHSIPVIFYDQLGCGKSTRLPEKAGDTEFWTIDLFILELESLCKHLGLDRTGYDLLGQSWGGVLAVDFAARQPHGLRKLVIQSAPASFPLLKPDLERLRETLPGDVQAVLRECEEKEEYGERYENACMVFYKRYLCRLEEWPEELNASMAHLSEDSTVYGTMNGPSEFNIVGNLKDWSGIGQIDKIKASTLLINGRYDEVTDASMQPFFDGLQRVRWITLQDSAHCVHLEETERFLEILGSFLTS